MKRSVLVILVLFILLGAGAQVSVTPGNVLVGVTPLTMYTPKGVGVTSAFPAATLAASACQTITVPVTGAVVGSNWVTVEPNGSPTTTATQGALVPATAWVSSAGNITVVRCNVNGLNTLPVAAITYEYVMW